MIFVPALFSVTAFISAFLLFWCQPLISKALLPLLGGAPSVWNTAMMFFQIVLLSGYIYAHGIARLPRRRQMLVHGAVLCAAIAVLPFGATAGLQPPGSGSPLLWLLATLAGTAGLPFFALSASAPLLQSWFRRASHRNASDPYFLYAASNAGSLGALLAFPFVLEPALSVAGQGRAWAAGFIALCVMLCVCVMQASGTAEAPLPHAATPRNAWLERLLWVFLGFVPSSLLLGVTSYVSADLAAVPLLWVVPLALYLITFIIAFGSRPPPLAALTLPLAASLSVSCGLLLVNRLAPGSGLSVSAWLIAVDFACFFIVALVCHTLVAAHRPPAARLTEFYVFLSAGGALGGIFNALLAPLLFSWTYEYEIGLALACTVRALLPGAVRFRPVQAITPAILLLAALAWPSLTGSADSATIKAAAAFFTFCLVAAFLLLGRAYPWPFAASVTAVLAGLSLGADRGTLFTERSFFGVHRVVAMDGGKVFGFMHGSTLHGMAWADPARRDEMLGYYAPAGPIGQIIAANPKLSRVAVIGLGAGAMACYAHAGQEWTFYEIDPAVVALAHDQRYFHFLQDCAPAAHMVVGDGRLGLRDAADARYDLLVIDAFSSDSIPMHLLTRQAFALYASRLAPGGLLVMHISNRFLDLRPVIGVTSAAAGFSGVSQLYTPTPAQSAAHVGASEWALLTRAPAAADGAWQPLPRNPEVQPWTDGYSNIFSAMR